MQDRHSKDRGENEEEDEKAFDGEESFADLLAAYDNKAESNLKKGDRIKGAIIAISDDTVFVDTGSKIDGAVVKSELLDEKGEFPYSIGDELDLYIVSFNESELILSRAISGAGDMEMVTDAWRNKIPVTGKVTEAVKGGFAVEICKRRAFCPISQMDIRFVESPESYIGQSFEFLINRVEGHGKNIVVSRRELLAKQVEEGRKIFLKSVFPGAVFDGKVRKLMDFGAFVELCPGVDGLVHVSEISWSRVEKPSEVLKEGDSVRVTVIKIETHPKTGQEKLSLSIKQAGENPWDDFYRRFKTGDTISGKAVRCTQFGVFVEIIPGVEGLVHVSEMSHTKRVSKPTDMVTPGDVINAVIKEMDPVKRRISLSMKAFDGDPWADAELLYPKGKVVQGTIDGKEPFGYFILLAPGVKGLLPKSKISHYHDAASVDKLKTGDPITVKIESISVADRKLTFELTDDAASGEWKTFSDNQTLKHSVGSLGEKLSEALGKSEKRA